MNILVIAPHMDDEVLGLGGTICKHVEANDKVKVCFVCNRAYGHKYTPQVVKQEENNALKAKRILGYREHVFLNLNDEKIDEKIIAVIIPLEKVVKEFKPQIVYVPHRGDINQDHRAVFHVAMVVLRSYVCPFLKEIYSYEIPSSTEQAAPFPETAFIPNVYIDIKGFIEKKKSAWSCYQKEMREFPHPRSLKGVEVLAMKRGVEAYLEYAEAFVAIRIKK